MKVAVEGERMKVLEIIRYLPESKLATVIDFASYLRDSEESKDLWKMQMNSKAYQDWLSPENDIYDEVFKDEVR